MRKISMFIRQCISRKQRGLCLVVLLGVLAGLTGQAGADTEVTTTISCFAGFDLATHLTEFDPTIITLLTNVDDPSEIVRISAPEIEPLLNFSMATDFYFGFNPDPEAESPIEIVAQHVKEFVVLKEMPIMLVDDNLLNELELVPDPPPIALALTSRDVVVIITQEERLFILYNITPLPDLHVQFTMRQIGDPDPIPTPVPTDPPAIPEPATWGLLGIGVLGLLVLIRWKRNMNRLQGGTFMKHIKTLLLGFILVPLLVGTLTAAELKVLLIGTGRGDVEGEEISCEPFCEGTYEKGVVVQLKAFPDKDSTFEGWMVNGKHHEGNINIDQEDILVAARFDLKTELDELTVMWYNGNDKVFSTLVLDEVAVFLEPLDKWNITTQEEFNAALHGIVRQFHPQAEITEIKAASIIFLKSPEPMAKEQLPDMLASLTSLELVQQASPVLYTDPAEPLSRMVPIREILVGFPASYTEEQIQTIEEEYGLVRLKSYDFTPNEFLYQVADPLKAIDTANRLYETGLVKYSYPNYLEEVVLDTSPNDPYFNDQWTLSNTNTNKGTPLEDARVLPVWDISRWNPYIHDVEYIRGNGVTIAIVDDGVDINHEDLEPNVRRDLCYDFTDGDTDPSPPLSMLAPPVSSAPPVPPSRRHGTAVSGISSARCFNAKGVCGAAPSSGLVGYRLIDGMIPERRKESMKRNRDLIDIYSNSWGCPQWITKLPDDVEDALIDGAQNGRNGLGNIYVWSGGNIQENDGLNSNYCPDKNSRYTIAVAASDEDGKHESYSAPGANILVNAPSGAPTTDRFGLEGYNPWGYFSWFDQSHHLYDYDNLNYTKNFGGTSAAAPLAAGVIALMLQAKPELTWRDVQHILIETATVNDPTDGSWNFTGVYPFSHHHGFGRVNAEAAINKALSWTNVDEEKTIQKSSNRRNPQAPIIIPDNLQIEFVDIYFTSDYTPWHWNELEVTLLSPFGTTSILAEPHRVTRGASEYDNWRFGSVRHFGEPSKGKWQLTVNKGDIKKWAVKVYGTDLPTWEITLPKEGRCLQYDGEVSCTFGEESDEGNYTVTGIVTLRPKGVPDPKKYQYIFIDHDMYHEDPSTGTTIYETKWGTEHTGTSWFPKHTGNSGGEIEIAVNWKPQTEWFQFPEPPTEPEERWCPETPPDYKPDDPKGPPPPSNVTGTLDWHITAEKLPDQNTCQVRITWDSETAGEDADAITVELQPESLCDSLPAAQSGTLQAEAAYTWKEQARIEYSDWYIDHEYEESEPGGVLMTKYIPDPEYHHEHPDTPVAVTKENPDWKQQPPDETYELNEPADGILKAVSYSCNDWGDRKRWFCDFTWCPGDEDSCMCLAGGFWTVYIDYGDGPCETLQYEGWWSCDAITRTYVDWRIVASCQYQQTRDGMELVPPVPVLEQVLTLTP